jgi:hypothetical protein
MRATQFGHGCDRLIAGGSFQFVNGAERWLASLGKLGPLGLLTGIRFRRNIIHDELVDRTNQRV